MANGRNESMNFFHKMTNTINLQPPIKSSDLFCDVCVDLFLFIILHHIIVSKHLQDASQTPTNLLHLIILKAKMLMTSEHIEKNML